MAFDPRRPLARQEPQSKTGAKNKPDSVPGPRGPGDDHSSTGGITPAGEGGSLHLPAAYPEAGGGPPHALPYLALLLAGFTKLLQSPGALVRSYRTFSPLPEPAPDLAARARTRPWRYLFCGTFLRVAATGDYPAQCPLESGLSSPLLRGRRPSFLLRPERNVTQALGRVNDPVARVAVRLPERSSVKLCGLRTVL